MNTAVTIIVYKGYKVVCPHSSFWHHNLWDRCPRWTNTAADEDAWTMIISDMMINAQFL